jgi:hypothetical protein
MNNQEIVELAELVLADDWPPEMAERLVTQEGVHGILLVIFAAKILAGSPYGITTDNAETIGRARSIADELGASLAEVTEHSAGTTLVFYPPMKQ